jgi:hypothetical protein
MLKISWIRLLKRKSAYFLTKIVTFHPNHIAICQKIKYYVINSRKYEKSEIYCADLGAGAFFYSLQYGCTNGR